MVEGLSHSSFPISEVGAVDEISWCRGAGRECWRRAGYANNPGGTAVCTCGRDRAVADASVACVGGSGGKSTQYIRSEKLGHMCWAFKQTYGVADYRGGGGSGSDVPTPSSGG